MLIHMRIVVVASALACAGFVASSFDAGLTHAAPPRTRPTKPPKKPEKPAKPEVKAPETGASTATQPTLQRSNRMELDARLVRGEAARSGAVYLFQRAPRPLPPLVDLHQSYLDEIVVPVLGDDTARVEAPAEAVEPSAPTPPTPPVPPATIGPKPRGKGGR